VIAYLDTTAVLPLLVDEPASALCRQVWSTADSVTTSRLLYVEAAAALARAARLGRLEPSAHEQALAALETLWLQFDVLAVDEDLVQRAATLARTRGLRGYDAVHCASALEVDGPTVVAVSGDRVLLEAWRASGIDVIDTTA
jgi:predicted nucleic acid-binding protein